MKHIFIINPASGKGVEAAPTSEQITRVCTEAGEDFEIYLTTCPGDATEFVKSRIAAKPAGEVYRFYACGGDGTLSEVAAGAANPDASACAPLVGVELGCMPIGTGNDFVRNFSSPDDFRDVGKQIRAKAMEIDAYHCKIDSGERVAINMINIGFDADAAAQTAELKKKPWLPKSLAYVAGVLVTLRKNEGKTITVRFADGTERTSEFELVSAANGGWCGGGFNSAPKRSLTDGLLDVSLIEKVTRRTLLAIIGAYKKGTHLETPIGRRIVTYKQEPTADFAIATPANVCIDGEIYTSRTLSLRILPRALAFVVPEGCVYLEE